MKYYRRRGQFLAVQFRGEENIDDVVEIAGSRVYYSHKKKGYVLLIGPEEFPLRSGDYIVMDGELAVWSEDVFETFYEEVK